MKSNYKKIGDYVRQVSSRNIGLKTTNLKGININKEFMPSVANINGTDLSKYKIVKKNQFAFNPMHVGRDEVLPISLWRGDENIIVSPAYTVFEITDTSILNPEYLMMWFERSEFDRNCWFTTDNSVRGGFSWEDFIAIEFPLIDPERQLKIVQEYTSLISNLDKYARELILLEELVKNIFTNFFKDCDESNSEYKVLDDVCHLITDGKHGDSENEENSGYYFISIKDLVDGDIDYNNSRQITFSDFLETHNRTNFTEGDIIFSNTGTIGKSLILRDRSETKKTTCQKSLAILKPNYDLITSEFLYCLLQVNIKDFKDLAGGTSQHNLLLGDMKNYAFLYPSVDQITQFSTLVSPIFNRVNHLVDMRRNTKAFLSVLQSSLSKG